MDETELMSRVSSGDVEAVTRLVELHYDPIFRLARHVSGNREDAEDLTQETFLAARTRARSFRGESSLRTWLTTIALNEWRRLLRREKLRSLWPARSGKEPRRPVEIVDAEWLLAGLRQLSEEHRLALLLHEVHGFSVKEVAAMTRAPEGTVKARLHYARRRLREILVCPEEER